MNKTIFQQVLRAIDDVRNEIQGLTFDQACARLDGFNYDGGLFDYDWGLDDGRYIIGTIINKDGKAYMNQDSNFYEVWDATPGDFGEQILAMTENEIREQLERLE